MCVLKNKQKKTKIQKHNFFSNSKKPKMSVLARDKILEAVESGEIKITPKPDDNAFGCASVGNYSLVFKIWI